jgi:hypothetical protein
MPPRTHPLPRVVPTSVMSASGGEILAICVTVYKQNFTTQGFYNALHKLCNAQYKLCSVLHKFCGALQSLYGAT